jgi:hypothetical protein
MVGSSRECSLARSAQAAGPQPQTGRYKNGRFSEGNRFGKGGNPFARRQAELRAQLLEAVSAAEVFCIARSLTMAAIRGDVAAARLLFGYLLGQPGPVPDPDRLLPAEVIDQACQKADRRPYRDPLSFPAPPEEDEEDEEELEEEDLDEEDEDEEDEEARASESAGRRRPPRGLLDVFREMAASSMGVGRGDGQQ